MLPRKRILPGLLDLLLLKAVDYQRLHRGQLAERIMQISSEAFEMKLGSLVPALTKLETAGCIRQSTARSPKGQWANFYEITDLGRTVLRAERKRWEEIVHGVTNALGAQVDPETREPHRLSSRRRQMKARLGWD